MSFLETIKPPVNFSCCYWVNGIIVFVFLKCHALRILQALNVLCVATTISTLLKRTLTC